MDEVMSDFLGDFFFNLVIFRTALSNNENLLVSMFYTNCDLQGL